MESATQNLGRVGRTNDGRIKRGTRIYVTRDVGANGGREKMAIGRNGWGRKRGTVETEGYGVDPSDNWGGEEDPERDGDEDEGTKIKCKLTAMERGK